MGGFGRLTPDAVRLSADDGLCGCNAFWEVRACPAGCCYDEVEASLCVGAEDVVGLGSEGSLDSGDVAGACGGGPYGRVDDADAVDDVVHVAGAGSDVSTVALGSSGAGAGVSLVGVDVAAVRGAAGDSDVVGLAVSLPVEGDEVAWLDVPLADEDAALACLVLSAWDVGAEPVDACLEEDPGDEHVAEWYAAGAEVGAFVPGVPSSVLGAGLGVVPAGVPDLGGGDVEYVLSCGHVRPRACRRGGWGRCLLRHRGRRR